MRRPDKPDPPADEPLLFDLPLAGPEELAADPPLARERPASGSRGARKPAPPPAVRPAPVPRAETVYEAESAPGDGHASRGRRFAAGLADLVVHAAIGVTALLGAAWMDVRPALADWPALAVLLFSFSFLYTVLPLAFWGHTPGMAWAGLSARNRDGEPLTLDQTVRRWLGAVLTFLTLGLPLLFPIGGRSLTDWISGSATFGEEAA